MHRIPIGRGPDCKSGVVGFDSLTVLCGRSSKVEHLVVAQMVGSSILLGHSTTYTGCKLPVGINRYEVERVAVMGSLIVEIRAGEGGKDACLFVKEQLSIYQKRVQRRFL